MSLSWGCFVAQGIFNWEEGRSNLLVLDVATRVSEYLGVVHLHGHPLVLPGLVRRDQAVALVPKSARLCLANHLDPLSAENPIILPMPDLVRLNGVLKASILNQPSTETKALGVLSSEWSPYVSSCHLLVIVTAAAGLWRVFSFLCYSLAFYQFLSACLHLIEGQVPIHAGRWEEGIHEILGSCRLVHQKHSLAALRSVWAIMFNSDIFIFCHSCLRRSRGRNQIKNCYAILRLRCKLVFSWGCPRLVVPPKGKRKLIRLLQQFLLFLRLFLGLALELGISRDTQ